MTKKQIESSTENSPEDIGLVKYEDFVSAEPFTFENGGSIPSFTLRYETYGHLNDEKSNAILICHAISGDHHCAGKYTDDDRKPGWWNNMIGPGKAIDTNRFYIIGSNCLGGCQGSTGPSSIDPLTGKPYGLNFPSLTIRDIVRAQNLLIEHLNLNVLYGVVGGSMGGMQVLQWAIEYPDKVQHILSLASAARQSAQAIAFNEVGRCAIVQDPGWEEGNYVSGKGPNVGLSVARMMAHITYLSDKGMEIKFGRSRRNDSKGHHLTKVEFEVEGYLRYKGQSFTNRFDANTYLYFSKAIDRFDLLGETGKLEDVLSKVQARTLVIGFTSDWLYTPRQNREIVIALLRCGKNATYAEVDMDLGHDSFLIDSPELYNFVRSFLND